MRSTDRTPVGLAPHAEALSLTTVALELARSAEWLDPDSLAGEAVDFALSAVRAQLAPIAHTLADSRALSGRDPLPERSWWQCSCCSLSDAALMRALDALGRGARDFSTGSLRTVRGATARADMIGALIARLRVLVDCPDCAVRVPGFPASTVLERDSQRRPRKPRVAR